jgi:general secretion pathway protein D
MGMRWALYLAVVGVLASAMAAAGADNIPADSAAPVVSCGNGIPGGINCIASKKDLKTAHAAYERGVKLQDASRLEDAFAQYDKAARLAPRDSQILTARELVKSQLVFGHVQQGNSLLGTNKFIQAAGEFRAALELDPDNAFARQRLEDTALAESPLPNVNVPPWFTDAGEIRLQPNDQRATFHYRGDVRGLFAELGSAYGITVQFDDSVAARTVNFTVDDVDFFSALKLATQGSKTMWTALSKSQLLLLSDTPENHRQFDRMSLRTFILPAHSTPQEATDIVTTMRNMFDLRYVSPGQTADAVEVRAPQGIIEACTKLLQQISKGRPQVMLNIRVYEIDHQLSRNIGVHFPNNFNLFNIPAAALAGLAGQNVGDLINQLIASGGINQAGSSSLSSLLSQLGGGQTNIFSQPLATFGGGLTFEGLSLDQLVMSLSLNESWARTLDDVTMQASQGNEATFHLGSRYPILNASYAPIFNSPQISQVLGNQTYVPPFPSVSYEDIGLNIKVKPFIHGNGDVGMSLELQVRSLTGQSANGVPVISNREYKGSINLKEGEPAVVAGTVSLTEQRSLSGIPGFGALPGLSAAMVNNTVQENDEDLLIVITPTVLANTIRTTPEIWVSSN